MNLTIQNQFFMNFPMTLSSVGENDLFVMHNA